MFLFSFLVQKYLKMNCNRIYQGLIFQQALIQRLHLVLQKKANPPIKDRIMSLNRLLKDANGNIRMTVDPKCIHLIKDLEQVQRSRDGKIDKSNIALTHMFDACSYYIAYKHSLINRSPVSIGI